MARRNTEERDGSLKKMLYYPLAFAPIALPMQIMHWVGFATPMSPGDLHANTHTMVFSGIFYLLGLIDVLLAIWTRPAVLLIGSDGQLNPTDPRVVGGAVDFDLPQIPSGRPNREQTN